MHGRKIIVTGLGDGGCKVVDYLARNYSTGPATAIINTDSKTLSDLQATAKVQIGSVRTMGLGTGGDSNLGRLSAEDDIEMIQSLFEGSDLVILVVGLGGGTGSGASPVVLNAARNAGALTMCFAILPFEFEGRQKVECSEKAVAILRDQADALIVVPNERLFESVGEGNVANSFGKADQVISECISSMWKLVTQPGFINLDFAHLQKIVRNSGGACTLGFGSGEGKERVQTAIQALLEGPLLGKGEVLENARSLLVSIMGGHDLALKEVGDIMKAISAKKHKDAEVFMGTVVDSEFADRISVTIIASDRWAPDAATLTPEEKMAGGVVVVEKSRKVKGAAGRARDLQTKLKLEPSGKGRFKDTEPTVYDGEDLDIPTFLRRGIAIER